MFITLLVVTFLIAAAASAVIALLFSRPINKILSRLLFAIYVVGISGGVRVWDIERYITPDREGQILALNSDRWVIEIYKTIIGALQSAAWMLLIFFLFALLAYVIVRGFEWKRTTGSPGKD